MHTRYRLGVHETRRQMRDTLIRIALARENTCFDSSGFINVSKVARALDIHPATVHKLLRPEYQLYHEKEYTPRGKTLHGVARLIGAKSAGEALKYCQNPPPVSDADLKLYIRPDGLPKRPKDYQKAT